MIVEQKRPDQLINNAIDVFLESLAEDQQSKAIAVILSGMGTDGTSGAKRIYER